MSAYCSRKHANSFSLGFKEEEVQNKKKSSVVRAPAKLFEEYLGALNTCANKGDLGEIHEELATSMGLFCFNATQVHSLREAYLNRLQELGAVSKVGLAKQSARMSRGSYKGRKKKSDTSNAGLSRDVQEVDGMDSGSEDDLDFDREVEYFLAAGSANTSGTTVLIPNKKNDGVEACKAEEPILDPMQLADLKLKEGKISHYEYEHICEVHALGESAVDGVDS